MENLFVIKIGGNIIDDEEKLSSFLKDFAALGSLHQEAAANKILVHGGGKLATKLAEQLNIPQHMIDGRRITDAETLKVVTMVYGGYINKNIVAQLQSFGCNAIGLCGVDGNLIRSHKRNHPDIDYGFAGDVDEVNIELIQTLVDKKIAIVVAPLTHDKKGLLLNTNADTMAQEIGKALTAIYNVHIIYCFEKKGVLSDTNDDNSVISCIDPASYKELKQKHAIYAGMIPKLDNAFTALNSGVKKVIIGRAENLKDLILGNSGTTIMQS